VSAALSGYGAFWTVLQTIRDANVAELRTTLAGVPARVGIVPGAIAWDDCGDSCGQLALAVSRYFLSDQFPFEATTSAVQPGAIIGADVNVQLTRCAPSPQGNELAPTVTALEASARTVLDDAQAILCSTVTALQDLLDRTLIMDYLVRQQPVMGPEGGCVGSELLVAVGLSR
jgi:hypothetical protein